MHTIHIILILGVLISGCRETVNKLSEPSPTNKPTQINVSVEPDEKRETERICPSIPISGREVFKNYLSEVRNFDGAVVDVAVTSLSLDKTFEFKWNNSDNTDTAHMVELKLMWLDEYALGNKVFAQTLFTRKILKRLSNGEDKLDARLTALRCVDIRGKGQFVHFPSGEFRIPTWVTDR